MKRSKCDGVEAAVFLSEVSGVFDSFFLRVGGLTLSSLNSYSKLCMSPPFTEALRCSYKGQRETKTSDVASTWLPSKRGVTTLTKAVWAVL